MENGVDKIRINPGNIGSEERIAQVVKKARERNIPIRIGVNGGSLEKIYLQKYGHITPEALVDSATGHINILHKYDFDNIIVSLKTSNVLDNIATYKLFAEKYTYPLHLGVTEAGTIFAGTIKSAIGIGALLLEGIGDTLRVSITGDPVPEIKIGIQILKSLGIRNHGVEIISCPTCGRCNVDLISLATKVEDALRYINEPIKVAVMGCAVNGPGEAKEADFGVACGTGEGLLFKKGQIVKKVPEHMIISELIGLIKS